MALTFAEFRLDLSPAFVSRPPTEPTVVHNTLVQTRPTRRPGQSPPHCRNLTKTQHPRLRRTPASTLLLLAPRGSDRIARTRIRATGCGQNGPRRGVCAEYPGEHEDTCRPDLYQRHAWRQREATKASETMFVERCPDGRLGPGISASTATPSANASRFDREGPQRNCCVGRSAGPAETPAVIRTMFAATSPS